MATFPPLSLGSGKFGTPWVCMHWKTSRPGPGISRPGPRSVLAAPGPCRPFGRPGTPASSGRDHYCQAAPLKKKSPWLLGSGKPRHTVLPHALRILDAFWYSGRARWLCDLSASVRSGGAWSGGNGAFPYVGHPGVRLPPPPRRPRLTRARPTKAATMAPARRQPSPA